jgi:hypothetical protein
MRFSAKSLFPLVFGASVYLLFAGAAVGLDCRFLNNGDQSPRALLIDGVWIATVSVHSAESYAGGGTSVRLVASQLLRRAILIEYQKLYSRESVALDISRAEGFEAVCSGVRYLGFRVLQADVVEVAPVERGLSSPSLFGGYGASSPADVTGVQRSVLP